MALARHVGAGGGIQNVVSRLVTAMSRRDAALVDNRTLLGVEWCRSGLTPRG